MAYRVVPCGCDNGQVARFNQEGQEVGTQTCYKCGGSGTVREEYEENHDAGNLFRALFGLPSISESSSEKEEEKFSGFGECSKCGSPKTRNGTCSNWYC